MDRPNTCTCARTCYVQYACRRRSRAERYCFFFSWGMHIDSSAYSHAKHGPTQSTVIPFSSVHMHAKIQINTCTRTCCAKYTCQTHFHTGHSCFFYSTVHIHRFKYILLTKVVSRRALWFLSQHYSHMSRSKNIHVTTDTLQYEPKRLPMQSAVASLSAQHMHVQTCICTCTCI
jgi:hypothetical protein